MRPVNEITNPALLLEFAQSKRLLQYRSAQTLADTTSLLYKIIILSDKIMPIRAYLDLLHQIQKNGNNPVCFEDEFVLAVAFLDLEVSKLGAITYLKGESPDFKETKLKRMFPNTQDESVLKNLSAGLTRPNLDRGKVEMDMIEAGQKRLAKMIDLHNAMPEVVRLLEEGKSKHDVLKEVKVGTFQDRLSLTDYDTISKMARREHLITFRNRQKDPANAYELNQENHTRVKEIAEQLGITPRRALNKILTDFWKVQDTQQQLNALHKWPTLATVAKKKG